MITLGTSWDWSYTGARQNRAMEGMFLALGPRVRVEKSVALSPRLAVLLDRKVQQGARKGLERRLHRMQGSQAQGKTVEKKEALAEKK